MNLHSMAEFTLFRGAIFKEYFSKKHFNTLFKYREICIIYFLKIGKNDIDSLWERGLYNEE